MNAILKFFRKLFGISSEISQSPDPIEDQTKDSTPPQDETGNIASSPRTEEILTTPTEKASEEDKVEVEEADKQQDTTSATEETASGGMDETDASILKVSLERYSVGKYDVLGRFKVNDQSCISLERLASFQGAIPAGEYEIALRKEGGRHATYWYKYGEAHKGMLWIKHVPNLPHANIHIGNRYDDTQGGIIIGTQVQEEENKDEAREVWYSDRAYQQIYPPIAEHLSKGGKVKLLITE